MSLDIKMSTDSSNIKMQKIDPQMDISGQNASFQIQKKEGDFKIRQKADTVEIDSHPAFRQLNSYNPQELMIKEKQKAENKTVDAISQYVRDGETLMKVENKGTPLIDIAKSHSNTSNNVSLNIEHFPKDPIEVNVTKGYLEVDSTPDKIETFAQSNLRIDVQPGGVYTTIDKYPKVNVDIIGDLYDSKV